ncbi:MAG TPA: Na+/H+ antiporter NhaA, partial [Hyphomicrobium sp.]|nr:Na+/H+ antiporter NhaA [Hyphomicrobium sp.]
MPRCATRSSGHCATCSATVLCAAATLPGALAGIGFTMSLFIAGQSFPVASDFAAAKVAIFAASILAACIGVALLWSAPPAEAQTAEENVEIA